MKKIVVAGAFVVLAFFIWIWSSYQQALDNKLNIETAGIDYSIKSGSSLSAVIYDLANKKIIKHPRYLLWYARLHGLANKMKTGDYRLTNHLSTKKFLDDIFTGKVIQYSLTIIEGWSFQQLLQAINEHPHIKHTITDLPIQDIMAKLGLTGHYEGQFLPDTYYFPKQLTDIEFLKRAYNSMQDTLNNEWDKRATGLLYKILMKL